jgi:hypothetical protein
MNKRYLLITISLIIFQITLGLIINIEVYTIILSPLTFMTGLIGGIFSSI